MPPPKDPTTPIARHEAALFLEAQGRLMAIGNSHRTEQFNRNFLPLCLPLVQAVGQRLSYEAAKDIKVDTRLVALYESSVIKEDSAWYAEKGIMSRQAQSETEADAADALLPILLDLIQDDNIQPYSTARMTSEQAWDEFTTELKMYKGNSSFEAIPGKQLAKL